MENEMEIELSTRQNTYYAIMRFIFLYSILIEIDSIFVKL